MNSIEMIFCSSSISFLSAQYKNINLAFEFILYN